MKMCSIIKEMDFCRAWPRRDLDISILASAIRCFAAGELRTLVFVDLHIHCLLFLFWKPEWRVGCKMVDSSN